MFKLLGITIDLRAILLMIVIYFILIGNTLCGCCKTSVSEGMATVAAGAAEKVAEGVGNRGNRNSAPYSLSENTPIDTSKWMGADLTSYSTPGSQDILNRPEQPVPLPEGEMAMFSTTKFSPECCPNAYSTGSGCACMTKKQYDYIHNRGGNTDSLAEF